MNQNFHTRNEAETIAFAQGFAKDIANKPRIICLHGDLGAGKTTFTRALIRAIHNNESMEVPSPTYTLVQYYDDVIHHYDLYRLENTDDLIEIGFEDSLGDNIITIIEWPERAQNYLKHTDHIDMYITVINENERRFEWST